MLCYWMTSKGLTFGFSTFKSKNMENLQIYEVRVFIVLLMGVMKKYNILQQIFEKLCNSC
jgi:hypothetical protein